MATPRPRVGSKGATAIQRADTATKHARVIELRVAGWMLEAIEAELGYADRSSVRYVLEKWVDDHAPTEESVAELRYRMLAQLDQLHAAFWPRARTTAARTRTTRVARQAKRVADIYKSLRVAGEQAIVVLGDLNDTPDSAPLAPLVNDTDLADITTHAKLKSDGRPGTFGNGTKAGKIDYILLSPQLFGLVQSGAIFRKGAWGGKNGDMWPHYPTMTTAVQAASDHSALYAKIDF